MPDFKSLDLVTKFEDNLIYIPEFQRDFVWSDDQVKELIESIYRGYPIGVITLWEIPQSRRSDFCGAEYLLIDGQQRIISLASTLRGRIGGLRGRTPRPIYFNPLREEFEVEKAYISSSPEWISISELLRDVRSEYEIGKAFSKVEDFVERMGLDDSRLRSIVRVRLNKLVNELVRKPIPVQIISGDISYGEAAYIYVKLNSTGTRVKSSELYLATFEMQLPHEIADEIRQYLEDLRVEGWEFDASLVVKSIIAILTDGKIKLAPRALEQAKILREKYTPNQLRDAWQRVRISLNRVIELLDSKLGIDSSDVVPTQYPLLVASYYVDKQGGILTTSEENKLALWLLLASYWGRYTASPDTKADQDLNSLKSSGNLDSLIDNIRRQIGRSLNISEEDYQGWDTRKKLLMYVVLKKRKAPDLFRHDVIVSSNSFEVHHIFPKSLLRRRGLSERLIDDAANYTFILGRTNRRLNREPREYLRGVRSDILEKHLIPTDSRLWNVENYRDFITLRRKKIVTEINKCLKNLGL